MKSYAGNRVLVIGLGASGLAATKYLLKRGAAVVGVDRHPDAVRSNAHAQNFPVQRFEIYSDQTDLSRMSFDFAVLSPGISRTHPLCLQLQSKGVPIIGEVELACREMTRRSIGITGTNGKTTVTLLTAHILNTAGITTRIVGNVDKFLGVPITEALDDSFEGVYVIELSSYQLETLRAPVLDSAIILNITPDHLDRYGSMDAYAEAKVSIKECLKPTGKLFVEYDCYKQWNHLFGQKRPSTYGFHSESDVFYDEKVEYILPVEYRDRRNHDVANLLAAYAVTRPFGIQEKYFGEAVSTFRKPAHRIEFVKRVGGVAFYDDSKGTNLDAVVKAVHAMTGPVVLIAGGVDKKAPYTPWVEAFNGQVIEIFAIGQAAKNIEAHIGRSISVKTCGSLEEAVHAAAAVAEPGMNVLLSPGCASFDMFKDYAHRGDEFKRIVKALPERCLGGTQVK